MVHPEADLIEYLIAQSKREIKLYPRSPVIVPPQSAKDIDMTGVLQMSPEERAEAELEFRTMDKEAA